MISNEISSLGIELECGFLRNYKSYILENVKDSRNVVFAYDGSVYVPKPIEIGNYEEVGEFQTGAEIKYYSNSKKDLNDFVQAVYEHGKAKTNDSCGFHLHVIFKDMDKWVKLLSNKNIQRAFYREFRKEFKGNTKYLRRLRNRYCKKRFDENSVIRSLNNYYNWDNNSVGRYYGINLSALRKHGTIEFRLLPHQETFQEANRTLDWFVSTIKKLDKYKGVIAKKTICFSNEVLRENLSIYPQDNEDIINAYTIERNDDVVIDTLNIKVGVLNV